jgi:DNA-binding IclR family transcriptional regulator
MAEGAHDGDVRRRRQVKDEPEGRGRDDQFVVRALARGLAMLNLFDAEHRQWSIDEMAAALRLPRMTAYRMARTLQAAGYLVNDAATGRYHLGPAFLAATYLSEGYSRLVTIARPYLEGLTRETGEATTLAVEVDEVAVCVDMVDSSRPLRREVAVGRVIGDTANAHGKMFAALKPETERRRIVTQPHVQRTPSTITDPEALAAELEKVRSEGVAFDLEERNVGTCSVVAPVRDQLGNVVATIGVVVPAGRFGEAERKACATAVKETAAALSGFFGHAAAG